MIGRIYSWRGAFWIVVARGEPFDRGPRRNVLLERVVLYRGVGWGDQWRQSIDGTWYRVAVEDRRPAYGLPFGAERVVRPFRGLRRATA